MGFWLAEPEYVNVVLGVRITVPDGWKAWIEDEATEIAESAAKILDEIGDTSGLAGAWRVAQEHTIPIIKLVAEPFNYPSIALALLHGPQATEAVDLQQMIDEANEIPGVLWVAIGERARICGRQFVCLECLFESLGNELFTRTYLAPWGVDTLSIKLVGDDRQMVDEMLSVLNRLGLTEREE